MCILIKEFDRMHSLFFALLIHKRYNIDMEGFNSKNNIPEITPQESKEKKSVLGDPFAAWLYKEGLKSGEKDFSHEHFIEDTIENNKKIQNKEEVEQALKFALELPRSRPDLVASLYVLEGNDEEALALILGYTDRSLDYVMKNTLILLLQNKSKEEKEKIMESIKKDNPALSHYIENRYSNVE